MKTWQHGHVNFKNGYWKKMNSGINKFYCKEELAGTTRDGLIFLFFASLSEAPALIGAWLTVFCSFFKGKNNIKTCGGVLFGAYLKILSWWVKRLSSSCLWVLKE